MKGLTVVCAVLVGCCGVVLADFYAGQEAYDRGDYESALREWEPLASAGDAETQYRLGRMYYHGQVTQDYAEAVSWYRKAADRGHAAAQNNLGLMYERGRGLSQDPSEAAKLYRRAGDQGFAVAQANLARLYDEGLAVPGGSFLRPGDESLVKRLEEFNRTQNYDLLNP